MNDARCTEPDFYYWEALAFTKKTLVILIALVFPMTTQVNPRLLVTQTVHCGVIRLVWDVQSLCILIVLTMVLQVRCRPYIRYNDP